MTTARRNPKTQKTPRGYEVPVPKRSSVLRDFKRVVGPQPSRDRPKE
jgi:hypothetical protein